MKELKKLYLLPGLMCDKRLWIKLIPHLDDQFELIHIPIPLKDDFDECCKVLDGYFKEEKINLLGFSFGSYIASYYTIKNPKKINRLFLLAGCGSFLNEGEIEKRKLTLKQMENFGFKGISTKKVLDILEPKNHGDTKLIDTIKDMFFDLGFDTYKKQMELSFKRVDLSFELCLLKTPIMIYFTKSDKLFDYKALGKISKNCSENIKMLEKSGESHFIQLEDPEPLSLEIKEWFNW